MRDEGGNIEATIGQHVEEHADILVHGVAHEALEAAQLGVQHGRPHTGDLQIGTAQREGTGVDVGTDEAGTLLHERIVNGRHILTVNLRDHDHAATLAHQIGSLQQGAALTGSLEEHRHFQLQLFQQLLKALGISLGVDGVVDAAHSLAGLQLVVVVAGDDDGAGAGEACHLSSHSAHEALTLHHAGLAHLDVSLTDGVKAGMAQIPESGLCLIHVLGSGGAVEGIHNEILCVLTGGDHHIAHFKFIYLGAHLDNRGAHAVTHAGGQGDDVLAHQCLLGAGAHGAVVRLQQQLTGTGCGQFFLLQGDLTVFYTGI